MRKQFLIDEINKDLGDGLDIVSIKYKNEEDCLVEMDARGVDTTKH